MARAGVQAAANDATKQDNPEVSKLLEDIKSQAFDLKRLGRTRDVYSGRRFLANACGTIESDEGPHQHHRQNHQQIAGSAQQRFPWQQEAIDRIIPVAQKLASNTTAAIEHLNKNQLRVKTPPYQEYVKSNAEAAANLAALVKDFVEYGKTRTTLEAYERKLEVPN